MRLTKASLSALVLAAAFSTNSARAAVAAPRVEAALDVMVAPATDSPVAFQTYPNARCVLGAAGTRKTMTVYADDRGTVTFHLTPARGGRVSAVLTTRCDARGSVSSRDIRFTVSTRAPRPLAVRPAFGARPLLPFGVNPATLTEADTKRMELPPRPDPLRDPKNYAEWLRAVTTPVTRIRGNTILRRDVVHGPTKLAGPRVAATGSKNGYYTSNTWSGVVDTGGYGQFTNWVAAKWTVPSVSTDFFHSPAYSSIWDGIDGFGNGDVIQNGTEQDAYNFPFFGQISNYSAWYEFYPDGGSTTLPNFSVNPGDEMYAESWLCYDGYGQRYGCYYLQDYTQGEATPVYYELGSQPGLFQGSTAEWIAERPTFSGNVVYPLPAFGAFPFSWEHVYDSYAGIAENACNENENIVSMYNGQDELASAFTTGCDSSYSYWTGFQ
jgi:hypothetical protein